MRIPQIKNQRGVSLLELLVAVTMFTVIILSATSIFKMVVDGQRNAISAQNVQENMRYALERMSKEIRMAQLSNDACLPAAVNKVFNTASSTSELYFKNKDGNCVKYYLENSRLKITVVGVVSDFITPSSLEVSNLKFYVGDDLIGAFHSLQPYVTMVLDIKALGQAMHGQNMKIQITVSSRYYE
ncbi:MAG: prepilin-type N-terminal cleavage/methylation domain-containing protein [Patescibacteria group bacterium]|nr:prepilin-type N-terminal cleavage/methylation domain-containing protein [Patescibacteria group bacterium]